MSRLLTKQATAELVHFHPEHVMRLARNGQFPRPIKTTPAPGASVRFIADEVEGWVAERMAARRESGGQR
jgi:predicted DNA-binding transcriptional regulator AlpA